MARGKIISLPQDTTLELMHKVLGMCVQSSRNFAQLFEDDLINALSCEFGDRLVRDYIMSMCKLGFLEKDSVTHINFKTTARGAKLIGKRNHDNSRI